MMQTDIRSAHTTGNGIIYAGRTRVKSLICLGASTAGDVVLYDNATEGTGTELIRIAVPGNSNNVVDIILPGEGILAQNGIFATTPAGYNVTVCYG